MVYQKKPWLKFYDPRVNEHVSVKHESLYDFLESAVTRFGEKPAFTFYGKVFSYNETKNFLLLLYNKGGYMENYIKMPVQ